MEDIQDRKAAIAAERRRLHKKNGGGKKKKKWPWLLALLLVLALGAAILLHYLGFFLWPWESGLDTIGGNISDEARGDLAAMQQQVDTDHVTLQINTMPVFENGLGDLIIQNPDMNAFDMRVKIYLGADDTGQMVYDSGVIPPGHYIGYDALNTSLTLGEHAAIAYISFWDGETHMTTTSAAMTLVIES